MTQLWRPQPVEQAYRELLEAIGSAGDSIGPGRLTSHWPLVGTAQERVLIVGQAVYGWIPDWRAADLATSRGMARVLEETQLACYNRTDPMNWIEENRVRSSPFWRMVRRTVELLWPESQVPWYSHVAWTNLYPVAPNDVKGNPSGELLAVQTAPSAHLLRVVARALEPQAVLILGGPYWWPFGELIPLTALGSNQRPLLAGGSLYSHPCLAGMHPAGAQRRGWKADDYARMAAAWLSEH